MKTLRQSLLLLVFLSSFGLFSQPSQGGPDLFGYTFITNQAPNGPVYQWFDISQIGTIVSGLSDDNFVGPFSISGFKYYSSTPSQLYIGSNGYIAFNAVNIASTGAQFPAIPTSGGPDDFIAPMLTDLSFGGASSNPGQCYYYDQGDTICISWEGVPFWVNNANQFGGDNSFQIILNKADSSITFNYKKQVGFPDPVYQFDFVSIGIENPTGSDGLQYFRGDSFPNPNTTIKFEYPSSVAAATDVGINWAANPSSGGVFGVENGTFAPQLNIKNYGNQNVSSNIKAKYELLDIFNNLVDSGSTILSGGLVSGSDTTINLPSITYVNADRLELKTFLNTVSNDNVRSNDTQSVRVVVLDTTFGSNFLDYTDKGGSFLSISWQGGNGGVASYYEPPYYPARVVSTNFWITATGSPPSGFHSILYDDNGRQGSHGTVLDSTFVPSSTILTGQYTSIPVLSSNIVISSGGVYLHWMMDGPGVALGRSNEDPASKCTYEILFGSWAPYRDNQSQDFYMGVEIIPITTGLKNGVSSLKDFKVYPNPAQEFVNIELNDPSSQNDYQLMDLKGRTVEAKIVKTGPELRLYRGNLQSGVYVLRIGKSIAKIQFK